MWIVDVTVMEFVFGRGDCSDVVFYVLLYCAIVCRVV